MSKITIPIAQRLQELLLSGIMMPSVSVVDRSQASGWCVSAAGLIYSLVADPQHPYRREAEARIALATTDIRSAILGLHGMLQNIRRDLDAGLLSNLELRFSARTFDDLLDHATAYLQDRRHEPAGVLAGVVFEDTVRKLCDKHSIPQDGIKLENLLSELVKRSVLTPLERKEATTASGLRTSATHARWDEYGISQVVPVIDFTRRLIREKLAN